MKMDLINIIFGLKVKQARTEAGFSLSELAKTADLSPSYVTEIEKGRKYPRTDKIMQIAEALSVDYDSLVSIRLDPSLKYLETVLASPLLTKFPFQEFGIEFPDMVAMLTRAPEKASSLLHAVLEIGQIYDMKQEHFLRAMLRSFQELHDNHFPDLENAAKEYRKEHAFDETIELDTLEAIVREELDYEINYEDLSDDPLTAKFRSTLVTRRQPILLLNKELMPHQIKYVLAREIGYKHLGLKERTFTSSPQKVESYQQVHNDFKASYFAGALLMPQKPMLADIENLFAQETWQPELVEAMLTKYDVTPEMLCYRFTELVPEHLGLKMHFIRVHKVENTYQLVKQLNMNSLLLPRGVTQDETHCRRWLTVNLLKDFDKNSPPEETRIGVQMSEYLDSGDRFLCIGFARSLVLQPGTTSSVIAGFRVNDDLLRTIKFAEHRDIPIETISETCERCPLTADQCRVRAAPPTISQSRQDQIDREQALRKLVAKLR